MISMLSIYPLFVYVSIYFDICIHAYMHKYILDYGHVAIYKGTIPDHPHNYKLDLNHQFITNKVCVCVCVLF